MCGIAGYLGKKRIKESDLSNTLSLMRNRGPDFSDVYSLKINDNCGIHLLHSRLSIIDLHKRSNQPFFKDNYVLIFNGEIYNFLELKKNLINKGIHLQTNSDTEVLLNYYILYGEDCVSHFDGMWSFAIYDIKNKKLFLSRDRFAEKPMYYYKCEDGFYFGSEVKFIKSLVKESLEINVEKVNKFLSFGARSLFKDNQSFFRNIFLLKNSENLICDINLNLKKKKYWNPNPKINSKINIHEAIEHSTLLLSNTIKLRMRSDVDTAFLLSGGIDSGGIVSIAGNTISKKINTYSIIDNDERYNESQNIKKITDTVKCNNKIINTSKNNFIDKLKKIINYHQSPVFTLAQYLHWELMSEIKKDGIKVVISGVAADEMFSGYYDHYLIHLSLFKDNNEKFLINQSLWNKYINPHIRNPIFKESKLFINNPKFRDYIYDNSKNLSKYLINASALKFEEENYSTNIFSNRRMNELFNETVPAILNNEDLNSMMNSIENRSPFLSKELFDFCFSLPPEILIQKGFSKYILRESLKNHLNEEVRLDRQKKGFNCSILSLINFKEKEIQDFLLDKDSEIFNFISFDQFKDIFKEDLNQNYLNKFLFSFVSTKIFLDQNNI